MGAVNTIEKVLSTDLLLPYLMIVPDIGAPEALMDQEHAFLCRPFLPDHRLLLHRWNGIALEVVRFFGCGESAAEVGRLKDLQIDVDFGVPGVIVIGTDASGFVYLQDADGQVYSFDTDGGDMKLIASDIDDFVDRLISGADAGSFAGQEWLGEIKGAGLIA